MAKVVSFINFKGGVGKTTLCIEIAAALSSQNGPFKKKVLIVDLDPQTNATLSLMRDEEWEKCVQNKKTLKDFFDACLQKKDFDLSSIIVKCAVGGNLSIIPTDIELFGMDLELAASFNPNNIEAKVFLKNTLAGIQSKYDYIFLDCPPNLYLITQNGLFASDYYVIIAEASNLSVRGIPHIYGKTKKIFDDADGIMKNFGAPALSRPSMLGIIFNRLRTISGGTSSQEAYIKRVSDTYPNKVLPSRVPQSEKIAIMPEKREPLVLSQYAADKQFVDRINSLAAEFDQRINAPAQQRSTP